MDTSILEDLGLTGAEIKVFLTALELGPGPAGPLVEKSGLQSAVVHRTLHSLIEKGLITYVLEGKRRTYSAVSPNHLLNFLDDKKERVKEILPELLAKQEIKKYEEIATVFKGVRGVKELLYEMLDTDAKEYYAYGGHIISNDMFGQYFWKPFHTKRINKGIKSKLIFHQSLREWGEGMNKRKLTKVKYTKKGFEEFTETVICGDKVGIIIYLDTPIGFLIKEKLAAKSYKKFWDILWESAED